MVAANSTLPQKEFKAPLRAVPKYFPEIRPDELAAMKAFLALSGRLEVELGCGKARFLLARAKENPAVRFFGIDRVAKWMNIGKKRSQKQGVANLCFVKADAFEILEGHLAPGSVDCFHIYFPDPWPKRRHQKRRFVNGRMLANLHRALVPGGSVFFASDDENYAGSVREMAEQNGPFWKIRTGINERLNPGLVAKTNYEIKYEKVGRKIFYLELVKA
ncbi:MAG: tRNA (guanosine(46)-N7)-methyltransferase TrmB [Candidatus Omnitrophota bacterium]